MTQEDKIESLARIEEQIGALRDAAGYLATGEEFPGRSKATRIWFALKKIVPSPASESKFKPDNDPGPYYQPAQTDGDGVEWDLGEEVEASSEGEAADENTQAETQATTEPTTKKSKK